MEEVKGEYISKDFPYISKSKIKTHLYYCPYLSWTKYFLKEEKGVMGIRCDVGTDTHLIFSEFWKYVDGDYIFDNLKINPAIELDNNPVTHYFYSICMTLTPEYDREVHVLQRIFWKFSLLHAARFLYLHSLFNGNKFKVWEYFKPLEIEEFYIDDLFEIFGTLDIVFREIDEQLNEGIFVADYKTGNIPASVKRGPKNISDDTSVKLPPKFMFEIHFYGLCFLLKRGWRFTDERIKRFVIDDEYKDEHGWHKFGLGKTKEEQQDIDDAKRKYLTTIDHKLKRKDIKTNKLVTFKHGGITLGIIFLSGDPNIDVPVVAKKKFTYSSFKTVLYKINAMRQIYFNRDNDEYYLIREMKTRPEYNEYRCVHCSRNERCLKEIEEAFARGE